MDLNSTLLGCLYSALGFVAVFIIKEVFWKKAVSNQERIDKAVLDTVKENEKKIVDLEKIALTHGNQIKNIESDVLTLEGRQREIDAVAREINSNMKLIIINQENTNKVVIDNTKNMHESTVVMREVLNELKRMKQ